MVGRATVQIHGGNAKTLPLPHVFLTPIRPDVVKDVHVSMSKNRRQAYAVNDMAGMQHSAESWGTGRAVARIPRVSGGGTHAAGQGAFGNMCRHGRMFAPTKVWRRWHRKINVAQKRFAVASAIAASGITSLVLARGHRIEEIPEVPLVVSQEATAVTKTKQGVELLKTIKAYDDVERVIASRNLRAGQGKSRNRRHTQRRGPLVIYKNKGTLARSLRNVPGVDLVNVNKLNLLQLAPGGHLGRFCIWTEDAFSALDEVFGDGVNPTKAKHGFFLPKAELSNSDLKAIVSSPQVAAVLRKAQRPVRVEHRKNLLTNLGAALKLNPHLLTTRRNAINKQRRNAQKDVKAKKQAKDAKAHKVHMKFRADHPEIYNALLSHTNNFEPKVLNKKK